MMRPVSNRNGVHGRRIAVLPACLLDCMVFRSWPKFGWMSVLSLFRRIGLAAAALAVLALSAAGIVAPRAAVAAPAPAIHAVTTHHHHTQDDADHAGFRVASHSEHAKRGTCGDACCSPVGCALPVPPVAARSTAVTQVRSAWLPVERLMDLGLAYSIERPPRG